MARRRRSASRSREPQLEINAARRTRDQRNWDLAAKCRHPRVRLVSGASRARPTTELETPKLTLFWNTHIWPLCPGFPGLADLRRMRGSRGPETGPPPVAWHPAGTDSSRTGVPPSRGRPPEQPRGSVVIPTRPAPHVRERPQRDRHSRRLGPCATRSGPSRVRRANEIGFGLTAFRGTRRVSICEGRKLSARDRRDGSPSKLE
jgi:hypothetical protein